MNAHDKQELIRIIRELQNEGQALLDKCASRAEYEQFWIIRAVPRLSTVLLVLST